MTDLVKQIKDKIMIPMEKLLILLCSSACAVLSDLFTENIQRHKLKLFVELNVSSIVLHITAL